MSRFEPDDDARPALFIKDLQDVDKRVAVLESKFDGLKDLFATKIDISNLKVWVIVFTVGVGITALQVFVPLLLDLARG